MAEQVALASIRSLDPPPTFLESYGIYLQWGCAIYGALGTFYSFISFDRASQIMGRILGVIGIAGFGGLWIFNHWIIITTGAAVLVLVLLLAYLEA